LQHFCLEELFQTAHMTAGALELRLLPGAMEWFAVGVRCWLLVVMNDGWPPTPRSVIGRVPSLRRAAPQLEGVR
jgi:hypothetical protein